MTRKYPPSGYCLAPPECVGAEFADGITEIIVTDRQTDVEVEIVFRCRYSG